MYVSLCNAQVNIGPAPESEAEPAQNQEEPVVEEEEEDVEEEEEDDAPGL